MTDDLRILGAERVGNAVVLRLELASAREAEDELVALTDAGVELHALRRLVAAGELPARRIGRRWYTTRRALARLVLAAPATPRPSPPTPYDELVAIAGRR